MPEARGGRSGRGIARTNFIVRAAAFAYCFVVIGLVLRERDAGLLAWGLLALQFLVYPQLAYLRAHSAQNPRRAEIGNLYVDSVTLGAWAAMLGFPTWIAYGLLFSTMLNSTIMRGITGAACAVVLFAAGALAWVVPMGYHHYPGTSSLVSALCFFGALGYAAGVGLVVYQQNWRLRAAHEARREGERRYRLITEHAGDLVAMVDRDGRWRYNSPSYERVLAAEDLASGGDAFRRVHEADQIRVRAALQALVKSGVSCRLRMRVYTRDGGVRHLDSLVHAVRDEAGTVTGAVLASRDVTELRDREEQLEVFGVAFEQMAEAIVITSPAGRILNINPAFTRLTGYAQEEVVGQPESRFRSVMQSGAYYDEMYATVLRSGRWYGTTWCQRRDGTVYREWRSVCAARDADGRVTHFIALFGELDRYDTGRMTLPETPAKSA